jgi:hypothetical protein
MGDGGSGAGEGAWGLRTGTDREGKRCIWLAKTLQCSVLVTETARYRPRRTVRSYGAWRPFGAVNPGRNIMQCSTLA